MVETSAGDREGGLTVYFSTRKEGTNDDDDDNKEEEGQFYNNYCRCACVKQSTLFQ